MHPEHYQGILILADLQDDFIILDYKKFINIQSIMTHNNDIKIKNIFIGELILQNCDVDIIQKSLSIMAEWIKRKSWWLSDLMYYFFN
jgi:hypothetical protein